MHALWSQRVAQSVPTASAAGRRLPFGERARRRIVLRARLVADEVRHKKPALSARFYMLLLLPQPLLLQSSAAASTRTVLNDRV